ncbi:MAG: hypothetical protein BGO25_10555 [Acidobacteriales bacterium 59-55]|nr:hypothetical protein [Terriglobales bacterium]OJV43625.1 MAG: hypothetical protein BGO25_10555 [Acidobacteriales bacterium 59-55]
MKLRWLIPFALLLPMRSFAIDNQQGRVTTVTIQAGAITPLHLRPEFESIIHLPEEVTSVVVGSPGSFHVEHSEEEPNFVYVKPIVRTPIQSDLLIAMKSGQHVVLQLISDGDAAPATQAVDFLLEYKPHKSFVVFADSPAMEGSLSAADPRRTGVTANSVTSSPIDQELAFQRGVNAPAWTKWEKQQIQTSIGDIRQLGNQTLIAYSILNAGERPVEIVPPQIQMDGRKAKNSKGKNILSDQLQVRSYRLTATRLDPGARADAVLIFDRPNFKASTESLFLQLAQANQVDHPILIKLPFTPPLEAKAH